MDPDDPRIAQHSSYVDGKRFDFTLTTAQVRATPRWEEDAPNPPLSARDAAHRAQTLLPQLVREAHRWRFQSIHLYPWGTQGWWVYNVTFLGFHPPGVMDGPVSTLDITVLMDATAIEPTVSEYQPRG